MPDRYTNCPSLNAVVSTQENSKLSSTTADHRSSYSHTVDVEEKLSGVPPPNFLKRYKPVTSSTFFSEVHKIIAVAIK